MKAKRYIFGTAFLAIWTFSLSAQNQVNTTVTPGNAPVITAYTPSTDVYKKETIIPEKKPVPYSYIREADVMWSKNVWRTIDLRHRMNMPLRYPLEGSMSDGARYSLFGLLMEGIKSEEITPYEWNVITGWKDPFSKISNLKEVYRQSEGDSVYDDDGNFLRVQQNMGNILQFQVQEQWFFDKQHSTMKVRIVAIAPIYYSYYDEFNQPLPSPRYMIPFVAYFPQCRRLFSTHAIYNAHNDAQSMSFDDLFMQRRFSSTIVAESNVFGNRMLTDYKLGQDVLLEAERIKNDLFILEHDLWEY
jgi:gliding motility associated protien GldN